MATKKETDSKKVTVLDISTGQNKSMGLRRWENQTARKQGAAKQTDNVAAQAAADALAAMLGNQRSIG
jgi:hypothetical protein